MEETQITWHDQQVKRPRGKVLWFTGLSGSGKSTVANAVDQLLHSQNKATYLLDGDNVRFGLCASPAVLSQNYTEEFAARFGLGFSAEDREENIRRIGCVADLFCDAGVTVLAAFVSPYRRDRNRVRHRIETSGNVGDFIEIFVDAPLEVCEARDPKGLYKKARAGELTGFTGIDAPYEPPENAEIVLKAGDRSVQQLAEEVVAKLSQSESGQ